MKRKRQSQGHSHPGDHRRIDKLGHGKKVIEQGTLTICGPHREGKSGHRKKAMKKGHSPTGDHRESDKS